ncbi:MAG: 6,7-dimethyl-8-ribityllumazine synthase [Candidatus Portiera sp.]|nr:6,7-dimethyl-8-ribityllumazine synthase [Portiera sp.]
MSEDKLSIGIVVSKYNSAITENLLEGAKWVFGEGLESVRSQWFGDDFSKRPEVNPKNWTTEQANIMSARYKKENVNISIMRVPGAYELPYGVQCLAQGDKQGDKQKDKQRMNAVIALGAIIQGETSHHDHLAAAVSNGLMQVGLENNLPVGFGLITANTYAQAEQRASNDAIKNVLQGSAPAKQSEERGESNKGYEAAKAVLELMLEQDFSEYIQKINSNS